MENKNSIFRQESLDRVASPEQLDDYIRVSKPSVWLLIFSFLIFVASVCIWGFTGTLPKTLTVSGLINADDSVTCYIGIDKIEMDITGCKAQIVTSDAKTLTGIVSSVSQTPLSALEISSLLKNDWMRAKLVTDDYAYAVNISIVGGDGCSADTIANVTLITEEVKPISYILN